LADVLDRYYQTALRFEPQHVVRLTADCPLIDPGIIDRAIEMHISGDFDYTSNTLEPSYPDGLDVEVIRFSAIKEAWDEARLASEREHVTPFIRLRPDRFRLGHLQCDRDLSSLRWTVDYAEDLRLVREVYAALYASKPDFGTKDVLNLLSSRPDLGGLNAGIRRNEGYENSLANDRNVERP
jgi:spore coat polysaccharide biosynthesis protein SpsF